MSKKTKRQKILADQRRTVFSLPVLKPTNNVSLVQSVSLYAYPVQEIRKDLTKTILLCILAISLEVALYFILEKNLTLPIKIK